jgi:hypothetical protein
MSASAGIRPVADEIVAVGPQSENRLLGFRKDHSVKTRTERALKRASGSGRT